MLGSCGCGGRAECGASTQVVTISCRVVGRSVGLRDGLKFVLISAGLAWLSRVGWASRVQSRVGDVAVVSGSGDEDNGNVEESRTVGYRRTRLEWTGLKIGQVGR